jgi:phosphotransferase system enzyme I (PtsI)
MAVSSSSPSESEAPGELRFRGIPVSPGIAFGDVHFQTKRFARPRTWPVEDLQVEEEIARLTEVIVSTRKEIEQLKEQLVSQGGDPSEAHVFDAHLLVLEDCTVIQEVTDMVRSDRMNVESVYYKVIRRYLDSLRKVDDPYLRERAVDIEDVAGRVLEHLKDKVDPKPGGVKQQQRAHVLYAHDLTPSDTVHMDRKSVLGFATELGSNTSHTAIMARSLAIPGVVGLNIPRGCLQFGQEVILDGYNGLLIVGPKKDTREEYRTLAIKQNELNLRLETLRDEAAATADGHAITLSANIEFGHEVEQANRDGAAGVGLYRTEFFYFQQNKHPDEDQQAAVYSSIAKSVDPDGVIIRTLDVGADKFYTDGRHAEPNPFLGWRGIRVSLLETEVFKTQLRACLRASAAGKVRIMYPMISGIEELRQANAILKECQGELCAQGIAFDENLEVGCMIELPSAAVMAHLLAKEVDFFSIGTNDLIQYTIAVDRVNERVAHLYQPGHPAILRLLQTIVSAAHNNGIWVGVCGEMAGDTLYTPILVGLGVDELSVGPNQILRLKHALNHLDSHECQSLIAELLAMQTADEIDARCREMALTNYGDFFQ